MTKLPEKLSDLIELALRDLRKVEKDERYRVNMYSWHEPTLSGKCLVCFAGAVMAGTLETPINKDVLPSRFDEHTAARLNALNEVRCGLIRQALDSVGENVDIEFVVYDNPRPIEYKKDPEGFYTDLSDLALRLREAGY